MTVSEATFYNWKRKYSGMGVSDVRELRHLRDKFKLIELTNDPDEIKHYWREIQALFYPSFPHSNCANSFVWL
ncbi:MAG: hypothetical protein EOP84_05845 [Verrucomicrobiaceae bacterium]|nr:MAG: hypothetical protein EOP84_05845 [Verrucomicrobiaceae bacterium]